MSLTDEISALKLQISGFSEVSDQWRCSIEKNTSVLEEIADIKLSLSHYDNEFANLRKGLFENKSLLLASTESN